MNARNRATIERLYTAFAQLDGDTMQSCYAPDARFQDEVFTLDGAHAICGMWRMLCAATRDKGRADWKLQTRDITDHSAHWDAHYRFSATGRLVVNRIDAEFEFDAKGLILRHRDRFDFWAWSRQALGVPGLILGWTPLFRKQVQGKAMENLSRFLDKA